MEHQEMLLADSSLSVETLLADIVETSFQLHIIKQYVNADPDTDDPEEYRIQNLLRGVYFLAYLEGFIFRKDLAWSELPDSVVKSIDTEIITQCQASIDELHQTQQKAN